MVLEGEWGQAGECTTSKHNQPATPVGVPVVPAGPQVWQGLPCGGRAPGVCCCTPAADAATMCSAGAGLRLPAGAVLRLKAGCLELNAHLRVALAAGSPGSLAHLQLPAVQSML